MLISVILHRNQYQIHVDAKGIASDHFVVHTIIGTTSAQLCLVPSLQQATVHFYFQDNPDSTNTC